jgi:hypothetical protein
MFATSGRTDTVATDLTKVTEAVATTMDMQARIWRETS